MHRSLAVLFLAVLFLVGHQPAAEARPTGAKVVTGESPDAPSVFARKMKTELDTANAAAQAALARLKTAPIAKPLTPQQKIAQAAHGAGVDKPCERTLFNVDGNAASFQIQPGQLVLLNGCFKGSSNAEVRITGNFPPLGYLLLAIQDRGDGYFYGQVPDVVGVPDQPVSIAVRFFSDGFTTTAHSGVFRAKRQTWEAVVDAKVCRALHVQQNNSEVAPAINDAYGYCGGPGISAPGVDAWSCTKASSGFRLTRFWWQAVIAPNLGNESPTDVRPSADGSTMLVTHPNSVYGAVRVRIEGPAGVSPF